MTVERVLVADDIELHVEIDGGGQDLVLLNGAGHNVRQWDPVIERLAAKFRTIRIDVRGVGESSPGPTADNTFERYADDIIAVCDHLDVDRALLWGTAWGARVALVTAARSPKRFTKVVLGDLSIDPADPATQKAGAIAAKTARAAAGVPEADRVPAATEHANPDEVPKTLAAAAKHTDLMPFVERLTMPTLIATGDHDPNIESSRRAVASLIDGRLVVIPLAGHAAMRQRPDLIVDLVEPFLRG